VWQVLGALTSAEASACLASGAVSSNVSGGPKTLTGRGAFAECDAGVRRVLSSFDRAGQPKPQRGQRFVAMSLFFYSINFARLAGHLAPSMATTPRALLDAASALCRESDASLRRMIGKDSLTPDEAIPWRCFDLVYAARLLLDGYNFDEDHATIEFLGDVGGVEVEWTLGALLHTLLASAAPVKLSARSSFADRISALLLVGAGVACFLYLRKRSNTRAYQPVIDGARAV